MFKIKNTLREKRKNRQSLVPSSSARTTSTPLKSKAPHVTGEQKSTAPTTLAIVKPKSFLEIQQEQRQEALRKKQQLAAKKKAAEQRRINRLRANDAYQHAGANPNHLMQVLDDHCIYLTSGQLSFALDTITREAKDTATVDTADTWDPDTISAIFESTRHFASDPGNHHRIGIILKSLAKARLRDDEVLRLCAMMVYDLTKPRSPYYRSGNSVLNLLHGLAKFEYATPLCQQAADQAIMSLLPRRWLTIDHVTLLAWTSAHINLTRADLSKEIIQTIEQIEPTDLREYNRSQILEFYCHTQRSGTSLPTALLRKIYEELPGQVAFKDRLLRQTPSSSLLHQHVENSLFEALTQLNMNTRSLRKKASFSGDSSLHLTIRPEVFCGFTHLDIGLEIAKQDRSEIYYKIPIEIHGPTHWDQNHLRIGDKFKSDYIEHMVGLPMMVIDYREWDKVKTKASRIEFLLTALETYCQINNIPSPYDQFTIKVSKPEVTDASTEHKSEETSQTASLATPAEEAPVVLSGVETPTASTVLPSENVAQALETPRVTTTPSPIMTSPPEKQPPAQIMKKALAASSSCGEQKDTATQPDSSSAYGPIKMSAPLPQHDEQQIAYQQWLQYQQYMHQQRMHQQYMHQQYIHQQYMHQQYMHQQYMQQQHMHQQRYMSPQPYQMAAPAAHHHPSRPPQGYAVELPYYQQHQGAAVRPMMSVPPRVVTTQEQPAPDDGAKGKPNHRRKGQI